ncbi:Holliday junction resolvase RuvX [Dethiobacter alkaliphilus]|uniref:Putative pre-16S rRNA nuclease n=1 Tax=Dethiobacter alkaliphilus AHT 1 TaxID=555088 RepID=C0GKI3_DETAL|nr:Holliday junction resolvase RuvX [Dethiobacter alkaliphilus]EEG76150.1 Holliday junction resolvase YqgF [Dethiobacter alkaliphilus AHT 1]
MRILGLDVGDRTIGVAASDALGWTAQGLEVIRRTTWENDLKRIRELVAEYEVSLIVVGYPKNMNNTVGPRAKLSEEFADKLSAELNLPVKLWDERLTTMEAERTLLSADMSRAKRKKVIDKMAAVLILQNYLQANPGK